MSLDGEVILRTDRLVLRRLRRDDAEVVAAYRNDPEIARYQGWDVPCTVEDVADWIGSFMEEPWPSPGSAINVAIDLDGTLIGDVAVGWGATYAEAWIGFTLQREHHGRGYATEAAGAVVERLLTEGSERITASVDPENVASVRVLERLGFRRTGSTRSEVRGEWVDDDTYAIERAAPGTSPHAPASSGGHR